MSRCRRRLLSEEGPLSPLIGGRLVSPQLFALFTLAVGRADKLSLVITRLFLSAHGVVF